MKQRHIILLSIIMSFMFIFFSVFFIFSRKQSFSPNENRYLQKFPSFTLKALFNGTYTKDLTSYFNDHFPLRNEFMNIKANTEKMIGKKEVNSIIYGKDNYLMEKYNGLSDISNFINQINDFYNKNNSLNISLLLSPTSITINKDKLPSFFPIHDQMKDINKIYENTIVNNINVYNTFMEQKDKYQLFYKTDHHWTTYGAYYAYVEFCNANNIEPVHITQFNIEKVSDSFYGTIHSKVNDKTVNPDSMYLFKTNTNYLVEYAYSNRKTDTLYETRYLKEKDKYSVFLDNNHPLIKITNKDVDNNKELVILKDSYANSIIPFLSLHFKKIHVIDPRYYKPSITEYIKTNNIKDVLILYNINTLDTTNFKIN